MGSNKSRPMSLAVDQIPPSRLTTLLAVVRQIVCRPGAPRVVSTTDFQMLKPQRLGGQRQVKTITALAPSAPWVGRYPARTSNYPGGRVMSSTASLRWFRWCGRLRNRRFDVLGTHNIVPKH